MKVLVLLNLLSIMALTSLAQADLTSATKLSCTGPCTGGTMEGQCGADIVKNSDGTYSVDNFDGGKNKAESPKLELNTIPLIAILGDCRGAKVDLNLQTGTGSIEYKYQSGFEGGGCMTMKADSVTCTEGK